SESVEDCAEKMLRAFQERDKLKKMGQKGNELVKTKYTYRYLTQLYLDKYDDIIRNQRPADLHEPYIK
ncbi:MAG: hypothetical protein K8S56_06225, partial [Candidatus Cloacimonetes bacterium]|nr:hypothetical protein [Candidatus Cloacimonadota bacterium]